MLEELTRQVAAGQSLTDAEARLAVGALVEETVAAETKADFLCRLALKGETVEELASFTRALQERALVAPLEATTRAAEVLDVVGAGGDQAGTFNISTIVALLCAAAGVVVAKHGNRAATSRCGSADVLEALGVPIDLTPVQAARSLRDHGFAFFFAPAYHPAFRHVAQARKVCAARGQRTIFNLLGPLLNPARPSAQLVGVPRPQWCEPLARALQSLGVRRVMVVCGTAPGPAFLDELSTLGQNTIAECYQDHALTVSVMDTDHFPLQPATLSDLMGGDRQASAEIARAILGGQDRGPKRDAVLLNAAAALFVGGKARSITEGWDIAAATIDRGQAQRKLGELTAMKKQLKAEAK